jgi:YjbE family integral membrane protein
MGDVIQFSWSWDFIVRFLSITLIDLALSGDNAIVIGMAAATLPKKQRKWAILAGAGLAIVLRVILTSVATLLMTIPLLSAIGGCVLFWVVWRLLKTDVSSGDEAETSKSKTIKNFRQALILIVTADFMMSIDNVLAVAGSAHGSILLIIIGLVISMPLLMTTGGFISMLIDKFKWLVYLVAAVISFTAIRMIFEDKFIASKIQLNEILVIAIAVIIGIMVPLLFWWLNKRRKKPRLEKSDTSAEVDIVEKHDVSDTDKN